MERDNRQRMVIEAMVKKLKGLPISKYNDLMNSVLPYVKTNMSPATGTMERDNRQRMVIEAMVKKLKGLPISKYNDLMNSVLPYVKTNMSPATILGLAKDVLSIGNFDITFTSVPSSPRT